MSGSGLHYTHMTNNGIQTFVIQHDMGKNAAYYIKNYFRRALEIMKAKNIEVRLTNDTLWVEFAK